MTNTWPELFACFGPPVSIEDIPGGRIHHYTSEPNTIITLLGTNDGMELSTEQGEQRLALVRARLQAMLPRRGLVHPSSETGRQRRRKR